MTRKKDKAEPATGREATSKPVTLKMVAEYLGLSSTTVSRVLNEKNPRSIPEETRDRVRAAVRELDYRPNFLARSLRSKRSYSVGVLVPEISEGYASAVMSGIEAHLTRENFVYLMASHHGTGSRLEEYVRHLEDRSVEGFILVAGHLRRSPRLPTVVVSGHTRFEGVTNVVLDHDIAAALALSHLADLGHQRIAFFRGAPRNMDADYRWQSIVETSASMGIEMRPELTPQLAGKAYGDVSSPDEGYQEGYHYGEKLLATGSDFTALFAFNDISAIGAMRAFLDAGLRVPEDVSVVGFDGIQSTAFHNPSLTTVRQPLVKMGETAGEILLERLAGKKSYPQFVRVEPDLVVRASTGPPSSARCR